ncbi:hypothetical protein [Pseudomonas sp. R5(2019)]|uniref:hypothetical protein n=1 Tax=Pseudomonas sp. R5(2019) TaxID=2697566 RepID=UPI0014133706|nr:hypothetical protein [Pseudomonas sp. R5(2019)]NBA94778.1 hypothetical protein [Pseudomonas sp. R5(2019)]
MSGSFDSQTTDFANDAYPSALDTGDLELFDEMESGDPFTDDHFAEETSSSDNYDDGQDSEQLDSDDRFDEAALDGVEALDDASLWDAFEEQVADGLDTLDEDEFLGRLLGGLGRVAALAGRASGQAGRVAGRVGQVAAAASPAAQAVARLARTLGAPGVAGALQQAGGIARNVGQAAQHAQGLASSSQGIFAQLGQLMGAAGAGQAFDAMAELYVDDGIDEALPAAVALAARGAARGLGLRNITQLNQAGRRALVRGVAAATRELVRGAGPRGLRALPRLVNSAVRVTQRNPGTAQRTVQNLRRALPRAAARLAQSPRALRALTRPRGPGAGPLARPADIGRGLSGTRLSGSRTFHISGPVTLSITPR